MLADLIKGLGQLSDPATRGVFWKSLAGAVVCFLLLWGLATLGLGWVGDGLLEWAEAKELSSFWLDAIELLFGAASVAGVLIASFLLFPAAVLLVLSFFLEDVCEAVEARHYRDLPPARSQPLGEMLGDALRLILTTIGINLLFLPLYLILLFIPPLNIFVFYGVNGYLLGREYFEIAAVRRLESQDVRRLRRRNGGRVFLAGVVVAILLTIPLVNLLMPIVATAFMVHVFERMRRRAALV